MSRLAVSVLLAVELGGAFGAATATVVSTSEESVVVEVQVEVGGEGDTVVAHLSLPGEETIVIPMVPRANGAYGVTTELKPADYEVVFEVVGAADAQSDPVTLSELGLDLDLDQGSTATTEPESEDTPETRRWLWLGVALGAASLSALAFWVLGGKEDPDAREAPDQELPDEPPSGS